MKPIPTALLLLLSLQASQALACSCMVPGPPDSQSARAGAVFLGEVTAVRDPQPADTWWTRLVWRLGLGPDPTTMSGMREIRYTFRVLELFKGATPRSMEVVSAADEASCGYTFQPGRQYVVYASSASDGRLSAGLCSLTGPAGDPRSGLQWLRANRGRIAANLSAFRYRPRDAASTLRPLSLVSPSASNGCGRAPAKNTADPMAGELTLQERIA